MWLVQPPGREDCTSPDEEGTPSAAGEAASGVPGGARRRGGTAAEDSTDSLAASR